MDIELLWREDDAALLYWKRWIVRFWQSKGVRIIVDLNVAPVGNI